MTLDAEAKKIELWGETGDRKDPDDTTLTNPINRDKGYTSEYSLPASNSGHRVVLREILNQIYREFSGASVDLMKYGGVLPYDSGQDYALYALTTFQGNAYKAVVANGPGSSNATTPGSNSAVWERLTGTLGVPEAPSAPTVTAGNSQLVFQWNCSRDNGAAIDKFEFRYRLGTNAWNTAVETTHPSYTVTGLPNGSLHGGQSRAHNSQGWSEWSAVGTGTPTASAPGAIPYIFATAGNAQATLECGAAPDNGSAIVRYRWQWRSGTQSFASGREATTAGTSHTVTGLTAGTLYYFRVRAENGATPSDGAWSSNASATPYASAPDQISYVSATPGNTLVDLDWGEPNNGGHSIVRYRYQWKSGTQSYSSAREGTVTTSYVSKTGLTNDTEYTFRVRAETSGTPGNGTWSADVSATPYLAAAHTFTSNTTFTWPYANLTRAYAVTYPAVRDSSKDIDLFSGNFEGGASDGTTIWFVTGSSTAFAYSVSTRAYDSSKSIALSGSRWNGGTSDGTTIWFVDSAEDEAVAYTASTRARDSSKDIDLGTGIWTGAACDGTTIWFVKGGAGEAVAYTASTRARDSSKDIDLGTGSWQGAFSDGTTIWFVNTSTPDSAYAYTASTRARDSSKDITIYIGGDSPYFFGGVAIPGTIWLTASRGNSAIAAAYSLASLDHGSTHIGHGSGAVISNLTTASTFSIEASSLCKVVLTPLP